jgi:polyisoprenoid-binding protein YceI
MIVLGMKGFQMKMKILAGIAALALLAACATAAPEPAPAAEPTPAAAPAPPPPPPPIVPAVVEVAAGVYRLESNHANVTGKVRHLGLSLYPIHFPKFDVAINFDPANPKAAKLAAAIDAREIVTTYRGNYAATHKGSPHKSWEQQLSFDEKLFNAKAHPEIFFKGEGVDFTSPTSGTMPGELTLLGVTKPVTLEITFGGSMPSHPFAKVPAMGFSAKATFKRSEFGMTQYLPNIGDDVTVSINAEFLKADDAADAAEKPPAKPSPVRSGKALRDLVRG